jgi:hypothetical protein
MNSFQHEINAITVKQCTENMTSLIQIPAGKNVLEGNNYCLLQKWIETLHTSDRIEFIILKHMVHTVIIVFEVWNGIADTFIDIYLWTTNRSYLRNGIL